MEIFVARQPIFDKKEALYAYELLFRDGTENFMPDINGDAASSQVLSGSFFTMGVEKITDGKRAFINFTKNLLVDKAPLLCPRELTVVEILEDVEVDAARMNLLQIMMEINATDCDYQRIETISSTWTHAIGPGPSRHYDPRAAMQGKAMKVKEGAGRFRQRVP